MIDRSDYRFQIATDLQPAGDQPQAIDKLTRGLEANYDRQTLLGVTGSGKTYTMARVIQHIQKPVLVIAQNKTLTAQLAQEYQNFFPHNAVHYFVSYYDYYQPEAYMAATDTYIEKEAQINEEIERLRHAATQALLTRRDVIVVASVSCLYGLGSPAEYERVNLRLAVGASWSRRELLRSLVKLYFTRTTADLKPGQFRARGSTIEIMPVNERVIYQLRLDHRLESIRVIDPVSNVILEPDREVFFLFPARHFVTPRNQLAGITKNIEQELEARLRVLTAAGQILEVDRLKRRTKYDLAMIREVGYCNGIENYSRHFSGRQPGEPPDTLLSYFPRTDDGRVDFLTIIDESHVTLPQISGMYAGDRSRKETLIEHGFRLPSAKDNRPLKFEEFFERIGPTVFTSATPGGYEYQVSRQVVEQVIRPTGLIDPLVTVQPVTEQRLAGEMVCPGQIQHLIDRAQAEISKGGRVLATTLTKKMAEDLTEYLKDRGLSVQYIHSDIKTIERIDILTAFRRGEFDCLVGVNLLREGLDLPEVTLIGILNADREGFLRSETALIQIIGRAARNVRGQVVLYADSLTGAIRRAMSETTRRRLKQIAYNRKHGITPQTISKQIQDITERLRSAHDRAVERELTVARQSGVSDKELIKTKKQEMDEAVKNLDFETAALLRDEIKKLSKETKK